MPVLDVAETADSPHVASDLGPLAWVLDELRKSLDGAAKSLKRFVREAAATRGTDMMSVDAGPLRMARQHLYQAVGALEMVGQVVPARMLRAMEAAVQQFILQPEKCSEDAAVAIERASFALIEYLEGVLAGRPASAVTLFPQYRDVQQVAGAERIHPADLWPLTWRWVNPAAAAVPEAVAYSPAVRAQMDQGVLKVMKGESAEVAGLVPLCLGLAQAESAAQPVIFWKISAGFFDALARSLIPVDAYVKRAASRILIQYASLARGDHAVSERLAQDLLFFCAQARPGLPAGTSSPLVALDEAYRLAEHPPVDYEVRRFGLFDPAQLALARKRIDTVKETWSAVSGGDAGRLPLATEQVGMVAESLVRLLPQGQELARALNRAVEQTARSGRSPSAELGVEVATAVLYLEAVFEDLDFHDPRLAERMGALAARLDQVSNGASALPLEAWMEELYRRVSDRQTMGTVVGELRTTLADAEKILDQFFRNPADKDVLRDVPGLLSQMRGVLSVLGLDQASQAVLRMRDSVDQILLETHAEAGDASVSLFERMGNSLGALGFLIDMLNYQPALAKKLFVFDPQQGELRPVMGRAAAAPKPPVARVPDNAPASELPELSFTLDLPVATTPAELTPLVPALDPAEPVSSDGGHILLELGAMPEPVPQRVPENASVVASSSKTSPAPLAVPSDDDFGDDELRAIFLEEAREVVQTGLAALDALANAPDDLEEQTVLRRAFHTLKGSSRMVGLSAFGEAAWSMEQVLNAWLGERRPASEDLCDLAREAMAAFSRWIDAISRHQDAEWQPSMISVAADAFRLEGRRQPLNLPASAVGASGAELTDALSAASVFPAAEASPVVQGANEIELVPVAEVAEVAGFPAELSWPSEAPAPAAAQAPVVDMDMAEFSMDTIAVEPAPAHDALDWTAGDLPAFDFSPAPVTEPVEPPAESMDVADIDFDAFVQATQAPASALEAAPVEPVSWSKPQDTPAPLAPDDMLELRWTDAEPLPAAPAPEPSVPATPMFADWSVDLDESAPPVLADAPHREAHAAPVALPETGPTDDALAVPAGEMDDQVKVVGDLRIPIPIYNVFLNEADEWSRRLATELGEWSLEEGRPVPDLAIAFAHSLAGSSATVGFGALAALSRLIESGLEHVRGLERLSVGRRQVFVEGAEEIRRLLHLFAAGFLKEPAAALVSALKATELFQSEAVIEQRAPLRVVEPVAPAAVRAVSPAEPLARVAPVVAPQRPVVEPVVPVQKQAAVTLVDDDDSDLTDAIDPDLFPIFEEEAAELVPRLGAALRQWVSRPGNGNARVEVLRGLHTLKGSARLAGAFRLGDLAHRMESEIEALGTEGLTPAELEPLLARLDGLEARLDILRQGGDLAAEVPVVEAVTRPVSAPEVPPTAPSAAALPAEPLRAAAAPVAATAPSSADMGATARAASSAVALPASLQLGAVRAAASQAVRVRTQLLDRLVNQAGEVMITRSRLEVELSQLRVSLQDLTGNLERLRQQLRDIELQSETQMQSRLALARDEQNNFDPLEFDRFTRVQELTRMMAESVNDVATVQRNLQRTVEATEDDLLAQARQTRELQRDLLRTRMIEFEGISERLYRVVRQAGKDTGKQVKLDITGGAIEMDRGVLDRMTPAFEHLLRNCVAHGVEPVDVRTAAGKDPTGHITIDLRQDGNDVMVEFRDDGAGLNLQRIRDKAVQQGLIQPNQPISEADAANLIFMPGFSTATEVSELAGRGIGMDVVRSEVQAVGGRIETHTQAGRGTVFKLVLPLTTAVTQVVLVRAGDLTLGLPANLVELVRRTTARELQQAYNGGVLEHGGEPVPFFWSGALLQSSVRSQEAQSKNMPVVIVRSAAQRVAMHVDQVLGNQEVVVKNLGPQLARLPGLAGMTVLASGAVLLIYNPVALASVYGAQVRAMSADHAQPEVLERQAAQAAKAAAAREHQEVPLVLVVDDSITVRRVTQRMLQREGYRVSLAADGLQALERLQQERPAVILSDIEMPRMDGFDLARNIRADKGLRDLPIIMITSRIAEKHREHARELGVNHYLGKPYSEEELLSLIRRYAGVEATEPTA